MAVKNFIDDDSYSLRRAIELLSCLETKEIPCFVLLYHVIEKSDELQLTYKV